MYFLLIFNEGEKSVYMSCFVCVFFRNFFFKFHITIWCCFHENVKFRLGVRHLNNAGKRKIILEKQRSENLACILFVPDHFYILFSENQINNVLV